MTNEERLVLLKTRRQHAAWCAARDEWREQSGILRSRAGSEGVPRSPLSPDGVVCAMMRRERARRHMLWQRAQPEACQDAARDRRDAGEAGGVLHMPVRTDPYSCMIWFE